MQKNRNLRLLTPSSKFCTIIADGRIYTCASYYRVTSSCFVNMCRMDMEADDISAI